MTCLERLSALFLPERKALIRVWRDDLAMVIVALRQATVEHEQLRALATVEAARRHGAFRAQRAHIGEHTRE